MAPENCEDLNLTRAYRLFQPNKTWLFLSIRIPPVLVPNKSVLTIILKIFCILDTVHASAPYQNNIHHPQHSPNNLLPDQGNDSGSMWRRFSFIIFFLPKLNWTFSVSPRTYPFFRNNVRIWNSIFELDYLFVLTWSYFKIHIMVIQP